MAKLGDVATYINGYAFKPEDWGNVGLPIIRIQDLTGNSYQTNRYAGEYNKKYEVNAGDILISWSASLGVYIWDNERALLNQHIFKVIFDKGPINKNFFVYQVKRILGKASNEVHGATMKHLTKPVFDALPFYLPSMDEQIHIASISDVVTDLINLHKQQLAKLDELVKARFVEMFGDCKSNPKGWKTRLLEDISEVGSSKRVFVEELLDHGIPFFRGTEISALAERKKVTPELFISPEHYKELCEATGAPQVGDLLMPSICPDGRIWIVNSDSPFYFKDGRVLWVHHIDKQFNPVFLLHTLKDRITADYSSIASGTTFAELKIFALKKCHVFVAPLPLQDQFADFVAQVDKSKAVIYRTIIYVGKVRYPP